MFEFAQTIMRPSQEVRLDAATGGLLAATRARYHTVQEYIAQFGAPMSQLKGVGIYTFADPICPQLRLLVLTTREHACEQCGVALDDCECPF